MTELSSFTTKPFTTSPAVYLRCLLGMWFKRYGAAVAVPFLICAGLGIAVDLRWLIVALMIIFIITPMLLAFLYIFYMLAPEARRAILAKELTLNADGSLAITYCEMPDSDYPTPKPELLPAGSVRLLTKWHTYKVVVLHGPRLSFILIPPSAINA